MLGLFTALVFKKLKSKHGVRNIFFERFVYFYRNLGTNE